MGGHKTDLKEICISKTPVVFLILFLVLVTALPPFPQSAHATTTIPSIVGWGGSRLQENENYSGALIPSIVFPGENASDQEILARTIVQDGSNAIRVSFAPYCTNPNGFMSPYNGARLARAIKIAQTLNMWIIVDYHGYNDTFNQPSCWLNFWSSVTNQFKNSYSQIIWEPLNEPAYGPWMPSVCSDEQDCLSHLSQQYQAFINQTRSQGDSHWIVVQNICSYGCGLCPGWTNACSNIANGYPAVGDPLSRLFMSLHPYMSYQVYHATWNYTSAENLAQNYYQAMLNETEKTGFPVLDTEGGPGPTTRTVNQTTTECPDLVLPKASGYCQTNLQFIQTLTSLMEAHTPQKFNWLWWPVGDWSDTPGAGTLGALALGGWAEQISWQEIPVYNLVLKVTGKGTIFPAQGNYSFIAGTNINIMATPATNNTLSSWKLGDRQVSYVNPLPLQMMSNQYVTAVFAPLPAIHSHPSDQRTMWALVISVISTNLFALLLAGFAILGAGITTAILRRPRSTITNHV